MSQTAVAAPGQQVQNERFTQPVKLVIWDLDDTFWTGTLSEGSIEPISANINLVRTLAGRGIVSSICSKNDLASAEQVLRQLEVWDYFVSPTIQWAPKGQAVKTLVERLNLRPENVVLIDDHPANLAEAAQACPGLMCVAKPDCIAEALDTPVFRGSPDPELHRLQQYRQLDVRASDQEKSGLTHVEFLRQSEISVEIRYDVECHIERIVELLNRTNQLNFTKVRIESDAARQRLETQLTQFGYKAGVVTVRDRYADYGIVGFFLAQSTFKSYVCEHFAFSCRILNMGVEQYVYSYLNRPTINVCGPVANELEPFEQVDWISEGKHDDNLGDLKHQKVVVVGRCDMLQLASYCSSNSVSFTNRVERNLMVRFDDPSFFLSNPKEVSASSLRSHIPAWTAADMAALKANLADADIVVLSFYEMTLMTYFRGNDGLVVRFQEKTVKTILKSDRAMWFVRKFKYVKFTFQQLLEKVRLSVEAVRRHSRDGAQIVVLSENTRKLQHKPAEAERRRRYNEFVASVCRDIPKAAYLDVNAVTKDEWLIDGVHMTRQGYLVLAKEIMRLCGET